MTQGRIFPARLRAAALAGLLWWAATAAWTGSDIGDVGAAGSHSGGPTSFTVQGAGGDVWAYSDNFYYLHEQITGDGDMVIRIASVDFQEPWTKVGVMMRESLQHDSRYASIFLTRDHGIGMNWRLENGGRSYSITTDNGWSPPCWVKLVRTATTYTGYMSTDGASWTEVGSATVSMPDQIYTGIMDLSHVYGVLCEAGVDNVAVNFGPSAPQFLQHPQDASVSIGTAHTFSVSVSGSPLPTLQWYRDGAVIDGATSATYTTATLELADDGTRFHCEATNSAGTVQSEVATVTMVETGEILREYWTGIPGRTIADLTASPDYPNNPSGTSMQPLFEAPIDWADNYGTRMRGYVHAPQSGNYTFWIASDDDSELWLSTSADPQGKQRIAYVNGWTYSREWTKYTTQQSAAVSLEAGAKYYVEVIHKENAGGDRVAVGWQLPDGTYERPIPGVRLSPWTGQQAPVITAQPEDQTVVAGAPVSFSVSANGAPAPSFQWYYSGAAISGATSSTYAISSVQPSDAGQYHCVASNGIDPDAVSSTATLSVQQPPTITVDPVSQTAVEGNSVTFTCEAQGVPAPEYQWYFNGAPISGATLSSFTIASVNVAEAGNYHCIASNGVGTDAQSGTAVLTVHTVPAITQQPVSQAVVEGGSVVFSISATGIPAPTFQWLHNGAALSGATSSTYTITSAQSSDAGTYTCIVSNGVGTGVTSNPAELSVDVPQPPVFTMQPSSQTLVLGETASFTVAASGNPAPVYQWYFNGSEIPGATAATYSIASVMSSDAGQYHCVAGNGVQPDAVSTTATLTVHYAPSFTQQPVSQTAVEGDQVSFSVAADGEPAPGYQWYHNGSALSGATGGTYSISAVSASHAGTYHCEAGNGIGGPVASSSADLTVHTRPQITDPIAQTVREFEPATFSVSVTGNPAPSVQWHFNGSPIAGATALSYTIQSVRQAHAGSYHCVATNSAGSDQSATASLTVELAPPAILTHPSSVGTGEGETVSFSVVAQGSEPLTYQWQKDGVPLAGEQEATYTIASVSTGDVGSYTCVVDNATNRPVESDAAALTLNPEPPVMTAQPVSKTVPAGNPVTFTATVAGNPSPSVQWYHDSVAIEGATELSYTLAAVTEADAGVYQLHATNSEGEATSVAAVLTVLPGEDVLNSTKIAVSGELYDESGNPVGPDPSMPVSVDATINLFAGESAHTPVYTESFLASNGQDAQVRTGQFCVRLGEGSTEYNLQAVLQNNPHVYAEIIVSVDGAAPDTLRPRTPLTASPYALDGE